VALIYCGENANIIAPHAVVMWVMNSAPLAHFLGRIWYIRRPCTNLPNWQRAALSIQLRHKNSADEGHSRPNFNAFSLALFSPPAAIIVLIQHLPPMRLVAPPHHNFAHRNHVLNGPGQNLQGFLIHKRAQNPQRMLTDHLRNSSIH